MTDKDDPWEAIMGPIERYRREEAEANRQPFLYFMVEKTQLVVAFVGIIAIIVSLLDVVEALMKVFASTSFWVAVTCGAAFLAAEFAMRRLPATRREKRLRKSSN